MNENKRNELLAFSLFAAEQIEDYDMKTILELWQEEQGTRKKFRDLAKGVAEFLESAGVTVKISRAKAADEQLEMLMTVQPRPAYKLEVEAPEVPSAPL